MATRSTCSRRSPRPASTPAGDAQRSSRRERHAGQVPDLAREVRLVGVAGHRGDVGQRATAGARASARWKRRIRVRVFAPYPNAASERRWSCRALSPTSSAASATRRPRRSSRTTSWRAGSGGDRRRAEPVLRERLEGRKPVGCPASTSATSRARASPQTAASATRRSRSSIAGSPSRTGASPGPSRTRVERLALAVVQLRHRVRSGHEQPRRHRSRSGRCTRRAVRARRRRRRRRGARRTDLRPRGPLPVHRPEDRSSRRRYV